MLKLNNAKQNNLIPCDYKINKVKAHRITSGTVQVNHNKMRTVTKVNPRWHTNDIANDLENLSVETTTRFNGIVLNRAVWS
ncbi:hypothetical protein GCM10009411_17370 [Shewanella litoralis]|uniref:Uncharacterized protein n=1 Tax=Shewanella litoralis TaxID=2282700 RepID=A0ABQ2R7D6_9GAMM|nr:hypothetical protein GCM10009411_17370 [Shewanella litoralis]